MYLDTKSLPPAPGGSDPTPPTPPRITPREEKLLLGLIIAALVAISIAPFAGSSLVGAVIALF